MSCSAPQANSRPMRRCTESLFYPHLLTTFHHCPPFQAPPHDTHPVLANRHTDLCPSDAIQMIQILFIFPPSPPAATSTPMNV
eukprot:1144471-Pelagomonas_calceolata.AAC.3